jgi:hypothetical protein
MELLIKSMINDNFLNNFLFLLYSGTVSNDEERPKEQSVFQKFRAKKQDKKLAETVSVTSLVRDNYFLFNKNYNIYFSFDMLRLSM